MARTEFPTAARAPLPRGAWLAAAWGTLLSIGCAWLAAAEPRRSADEEWSSIVERLEATLERESDSMHRSAEALRALFESSQRVDRDEFQRFARTLLAQDDASVELAYFARVPQSAPDASTAPAASFVLEFSARRDASEREPGLELDPALVARLVRSSGESGAHIVRDPLTVNTENPCLIAAAAVQRRPVSELEARRDQRTLDGFAMARFDTRVLLRRGLAVGPEDFVVGSILDAQSSEPLLRFGADRRDWEATSWTERELDFGGLSWTLRARPSAAWHSQHVSYLPWGVLVLGLLFTAALVWHLAKLEERRVSLSRTNAELYTEVAERHSIERELRETQRALSTLVANLQGMAYRCANNADFSMEFISDGCIPLTGWTPSDFVTGRVSFGKDVIHRDDQRYVWNAVQLALETHKPFQLRYRVRTRQGDERWVWEQGRGVYSRAGELLALEGFITDITDQRRAEESARAEQSFTRATIESLPGTYYVFDEAGRFLRWNQNVERITGYSRDELVSMSPIDFFEEPHRERIAEAVAQAFREGSTQVDAPLRRKDGVCIPFAFTAKRLELDGARYMVGVGLDMSEAERLRSAHARIETQLVQTQKLEAVGVMAGSVAHDFNNMLTVVLGLTGLAKGSLEPDSPAAELLERALGASRNAHELTQQLLSFASRRTSEPRALDLSREVEKQRELMQATVTSRVKLELVLARDLPQVVADRGTLLQVIQSLVQNAAESLAERSNSVRIETLALEAPAGAPVGRRVLGVRRPGPCVALAVRDNGVGMPSEVLEHLGEPFFTTKWAGRGLGLAAALQVLRALHGWLEIESSPGHGTTAWMMLALSPAPHEIQPNRSPSDATPDTATSGSAANA